MSSGVLLPGRADSDSSDSSRNSAPRVPGVAVFDRRSLVADDADGKCREAGVQFMLTLCVEHVKNKWTSKRNVRFTPATW
jgi:hypothetical protein